MKLLVVDDHRLFADGLVFMLSAAFDKVDSLCAPNAAEAADLLDSNEDIDLVLLDLALGGGESGMDFLTVVRERSASLPVLVLSGSSDPRDAAQAMALGARGFVSKSAPAEELRCAIETVIAGRDYLPAGLASMLAQLPRAPESDPQTQCRLTLRQGEVLAMVADGLQNKEIAARLQIAEQTVKVHLREVFKVLGVSNRTACVKEAHRRKLL